MHRVTEAALRADSLESLYATALETVADALRVEHAAILLRDESGQMRFKAWIGLSDGYRAAVEGHMPWSQDQSDPLPLIIDEADTDPGTAPFRQALRLEGIRSLAFIPLIHQGRLIGKFMLYADAPGRFGAEDVRLAITLAGTIALAIVKQGQESELRERQARLDALLKALPVMVYEAETGSPMGATWISANVEELTGAPARAFLETPQFWMDHVHPEDRPRVAAAFAGAVLGVPIEVEYRWRHGDGKYHRYLERCDPVKALPDGRLRLVGVWLDITERSKVEQALQQAQKLESLGLLAGGIAHDFNNLLTAIVGQMDLARLRLDDRETARLHLERASVAVSKAAGLTRQMLAYSGRGRFQVQPQDLNAVIRDMEDLMRASLSKRVALDFDLEEHLPSIEGDATQLQQVVLNLLTNASEAMEGSNGTIRLRTRSLRMTNDQLAHSFPIQKVREGELVLLEVQDSGCGIDPEVQSRIFDPFFSTKATGRGLGLAVLQGIVRSHGGGISMESRPGSGSVFRIAFPALPGDAAAIAASGRPGRASSRGCVLLVDDEEVILESTGGMLESLGFEVRLAHDGVQALERFRELAGKGLQFVLMDLSMPRLDGYSAFLEMRNLAPDLPVILSSGYDAIEFQAAWTAEPPRAVLQKPYRFAELKDLLDGCGLL